MEVVSKLLIAILVIGTHIEEQRNVALEFLDAFQLKGREFHHEGSLQGGRPGSRFDPLDEWRANIAGHHTVAARALKQLTNEGGGRCFPVGAANADEFAVQKAIGQLDLAIDGDLPLRRCKQLRQVGGNTRAEDDKICTQKVLSFMTAQGESGGLAQLRNPIF